ncbi:MAG: zf-TFIIB domain-containing protein [Deltaproteobacteria bacterium]|nr:zf-TFIIB domain-containing protein [Deltaproteobacteria bacterium]
MDPYRARPALTAPCPRCGDVELSTRAVADARIDECSRCSGVFVPGDLMPRFLDALDLGGLVLDEFPPGTPVAHPGGPMYVKCPRCRIVMNRRLFATGARVVIDVCKLHGIWFDDAELHAIAAFAANGGMERAASADAKRLAAEKADADRRASAHVPWVADPADLATQRRVSILDAVLGFLFR